MKRILFLILVLFTPIKVFSECAFIDMLACPTTDCSFGTFMGDDGKCYECTETKGIGIDCIGKEKASSTCPNRLIIGGCGIYSILCPKNICPQGKFMGDDGNCYDCDIDDVISINCLGSETVKSICPNRGLRFIGESVRSHNCEEKDEDCKIYPQVIDL